MDKPFDYKTTGNGVIIILSLFIIVFFIFNELFDLGLSAAIIIPLVLALALGFFILSKRINVSDYVLLPVIILDGFFHLTSPLENLIENSPDWVIAFNLYGGNGMPVIIHQIMGIFLLITSAGFVYLLTSKKKNWTYYFYKYVIVIITLIIISFSYLIKLFSV